MGTTKAMKGNPKSFRWTTARKASSSWAKLMVKVRRRTTMKKNRKKSKKGKSRLG